MRRWAALAVCCLATAAQGEETPASWYLRIDNDVAFHTDRWYTSGLRLARVKGDWEWGLVQEIYTPEAKHLSPTLEDRAPAGRLFASVARHLRTENTFDTFEAQLGVRGPSALGEQTQTTVHQIVPGPHVDWSRQLPDALDASAIGVRTVALAGPVRAHFGAVLGTQVTFAHVGIEGRFGDAAAPSSALMRFAATPPMAARPGWSGYLGASVRAVARNDLLSRNYYEFGPDLRRRDGVARAAGGIAWSQPWGDVAFDVAQDTREFEGQRVAHAFGSIAIHVAF
ncbi:MAG TPA: lipid A deacylase LpxR family protein [Usitatibacter sp.]|nr:lipid A deacylase LpxR family protein [Usitatibacter sp.]